MYVAKCNNGKEGKYRCHHGNEYYYSVQWIIYGVYVQDYHSPGHKSLLYLFYVQDRKFLSCAELCLLITEIYSEVKLYGATC